LRAKFRRSLGTHRFQRAVVGKGVLIGIRHSEGASLASSDYSLQSRVSGLGRASGLPWGLHPRLHAGSDAYPGSFR